MLVDSYGVSLHHAEGQRVGRVGCYTSLVAGRSTNTAASSWVVWARITCCTLTLTAPWAAARAEPDLPALWPVAPTTPELRAVAPAREGQGVDCSVLRSRAIRDLEQAELSETAIAQTWNVWAEGCPGVVEVARLAAVARVQRWLALPPGANENTSFDDWRRENANARDSALEWLASAQREQLRSGGASWHMHYWQGLALLGLGRADAAREAFESCRLPQCRVAAYRVLRGLALALLANGELERALEVAYESLDTAPRRWRAASAYVMALIFDRGGDRRAAEDWARWALDRDRGRISVRIIASALPLGERLIASAFLHGLHANEGSAALRYWKAFMALKGQSRSDRAYAARHIQDLESRL